MTFLRFFASSSAAMVIGLYAARVHATDAPPGSWSDSITLGVQTEAGFLANPVRPKTNYGSEYEDHPNQVQINQILLTLKREISKDSDNWDVGFKFQTIYGSDARYTLYVGLLNYAIVSRYQFTPLEAHVMLHMPLLTEGGIDLKVGMYASPLGTESIDTTSNVFYSHSYIYTFGMPATHTGALATAHVNNTIDLYAGFDTGGNTSLPPGGDNNSVWGGIVGFGLNMLGGNLTVLALSHIGPENPSLTPAQSVGVPNANHYNRYYNDIYAIWKITDAFTITTELDYTRDDLIGAEAIGFAQYAVYALSDKVAMNARGEIFRDGKGYYVGYFPGNNDYIKSESGRPNGSVTWPNSPHDTYGALTLGLTWKPDLPMPIRGLMLRPEIRYDVALAGPRPFNGGKDRDSLTFGADAVLSF